MEKTTFSSTVGPKLEAIGLGLFANVDPTALRISVYEIDFMHDRVVQSSAVVRFDQYVAAVAAGIDPRPGAGPKAEPLSSMKL